MIIRNNASHQRAPCIVNQTDETRACAMRVVLADDHPIVLGGLRALLQAEPGVEIAAAALDGATALEMIRAHEPEIAVLDINMPQLTGLEVLEALEADGLATRVVLLTGSVSDEQIATAVERGAWGLLLKESAPGTLIACLKTVAAGQRWLPEELVAPAIRRAAERRATDGPAGAGVDGSGVRDCASGCAGACRTSTSRARSPSRRGRSRSTCTTCTRSLGA